jgi:hypothetical protein
VLSGDYYQQLSTSSPHQIWSAAMVLSPILRGMFGLSVDSASHTLSLRPHVPADWEHFQISNVHVGTSTLDMSYHKALDGITLEVRKTGKDACTLKFSPAFSERAQIGAAEANGRKLEIHGEDTGSDQHAEIEVSLKESVNTLRINTRNDFGVALHSRLPELGAPSSKLKMISETWSADRGTLEFAVAGIAGGAYDLAVWNGGQIASVDGGQVVKNDRGASLLRVTMPLGDADTYIHSKVVIHFGNKSAAGKPAKGLR